MLICYNYIGSNTSGWFRQFFISAHNNNTWVRQHAGANYSSDWAKLAFSDIANVKPWQSIVSTKETGEYTVTVPNMANNYTEILITYGYLYSIEKSLLIPYGDFVLLNGVGLKAYLKENASVWHENPTTIGIANDNSDYLVRVFAR